MILINNNYVLKHFFFKIKKMEQLSFIIERTNDYPKKVGDKKIFQTFVNKKRTTFVICIKDKDEPYRLVYLNIPKPENNFNIFDVIYEKQFNIITVKHNLKKVFNLHPYVFELDDFEIENSSLNLINLRPIKVKIIKNNEFLELKNLHSNNIKNTIIDIMSSHFKRKTKTTFYLASFFGCSIEDTFEISKVSVKNTNIDENKNISNNNESNDNNINNNNVNNNVNNKSD